MLSDRFVRNVLSPTLLLIFLVLISPAILTAIIVYGTEFLRGAEPDYVLRIMNMFNNFKGLPKDIASLVMQTLPALIGAICYRSEPNKTLNWIGRLAFFLLVFGALLSGALIIFLAPENPHQIGALTDGKEGLLLLEANCEATLRISLTYILLFTGLQIKVGSSSSGEKK